MGLQELTTYKWIVQRRLSHPSITGSVAWQSKGAWYHEHAICLTPAFRAAFWHRIWWDSSPLVFTRWRDETRSAWADHPRLTAALDELTFTSLDGVLRGVHHQSTSRAGGCRHDRRRWIQWAEERRKFWTVLKSWPGHSTGRCCAAARSRCCRSGSSPMAPWARSAGRWIRACCTSDAMVKQGIELHATCPNVMVKMPATERLASTASAFYRHWASLPTRPRLYREPIMATARAAREGPGGTGEGRRSFPRPVYGDADVGSHGRCACIWQQALAAGITLSESVAAGRV